MSLRVSVYISNASWGGGILDKRLLDLKQRMVSVLMERVVLGHEGLRGIKEPPAQSVAPISSFLSFLGSSHKASCLVLGG